MSNGQLVMGIIEVGGSVCKLNILPHFNSRGLLFMSIGFNPGCTADKKRSWQSPLHRCTDGGLIDLSDKLVVPCRSIIAMLAGSRSVGALMSQCCC